MNTTPGLRFLRPYLQQDLPALKRTAYLRFFSSSQSCRSQLTKVKVRAVAQPYRHKHSPKSDVQGRIDELEKARKLEWPRLQRNRDAMTLLEFTAKYSGMLPVEIRKSDFVMLRGM